MLVDIGLPGMSGYELCAQLKREPALANARLIAITAYAGDEHRARALAAGCDRHFAKPISAQALFELLESGLAA